ncbi:methyl-accepting chemotaxis protein [Rubellicoccus peritrichatus]|uniref:Methyl-accepting chemotaxis protein n=1 Tax=Rubellicoccus peritrichatus TaxID=3080537 RepID=A0AAQ3QX19_9BACT|nr:methyl-accepting chemotaxis protein [Puniceicoccus sp. CR14]WOO42542.1 methyl-accepting chemotaxis protein [Puniceicoccus sp. CR14]
MKGNRIIPVASSKGKAKAAKSAVHKKAKQPKNPEEQEGRHGLSRLMLRYFLVIALIPLVAVSVINFLTAKRTVLETEGKYLGTIAQRQVQEIHSYLEEMDDFAQLLSQSPAVVLTLQSLGGVNEQNLEKMLAMDEYQEVQRNVGPILQQFVNKFGFSQLYLVNPDGMVAYSVPFLALEHRNLEKKPNSATELGRVFKRTSAMMSSQASDYRIYPPTEQPSIFISSPVIHQGLYLGAVILSLDNEKLKEKLSGLEGLGENADIMLTSRVGDEILFLTDLRGNPNSAFSLTIPYEPAEGEELTPVQRSVRGQSGGALTKDFEGNEVIALWDYLPNLRIGLAVKVDKDEVFAPVNRLLRINIIVALITVLIVAIVAIMLSRSITHPINMLTQAANNLAEGDLRGEIPCRGRNEVGQLANATRTMSRNLKSLVGKVKVTGSEITKTAQFVSTNAQEQVNSAQQTGTSAIEVNTTAKQISTTSKELANTMTEVNDVTQEIALKAESDLDVLAAIQESMSKLDKANVSISGQLERIQKRANGITGIIVTMTKVADQTNLLSLNASIEARKAGQYGRGFSVVAAEIRRLADQAAASTLEIEGSVKDMLGAVQTGVGEVRGFSSQVSQSIEEITAISGRLTEVIQQVQGLPPRFDQILEGMHSQSEGAEQINQAMGQLSDSAQHTVSAVKETHRMLSSLRRSAEVLDAEISRFKT